jgi:hypothetical protein
MTFHKVSLGMPAIFTRFRARHAWRDMRVGRAARGVLCSFHSCRHCFCLLLPRHWYREDRGACTFLGHVCGELPLFLSVSRLTPSSFNFVRSAVGVILTSPSCLVEGVRSGSRRRNAATPYPLARGCAGPESRPAAPAWVVAALSSWYVGDAGDMRGDRAGAGIAQRAFRHGHSI